ncbi:alpha-mannosyltransferase [Anopheles sinensis]|uniref:Alpha-mannosyltransferase n=1 Tax=Anopheles sinensis TaxID=74873 RepID=A0A084VY40_ANOSI|nr:alpha-mannosyltransferase [Anopheles sinensis]
MPRETKVSSPKEMGDRESPLPASEKPVATIGHKLPRGVTGHSLDFQIRHNPLVPASAGSGSKFGVPQSLKARTGIDINR